jgi:transposase
MSTETAPLATSVGPERTALGEELIVGRERWEEIRRARASERLTVSAIARRFDLDRKTVRRCLRLDAWQPYHRAARTDTLLAAHAEFVRSRAPEVQYSARILFQELRQHRGYRESYDTVKRVVQPLRAVRLQAERALTRFETPPGQQSQIDWGQARVWFRQQPRVVHVFVLTLARATPARSPLGRARGGRAAARARPPPASGARTAAGCDSRSAPRAREPAAGAP